jgi:hypothetical protein
MRRLAEHRKVCLEMNVCRSLIKLAVRKISGKA